MTDSVQAIAQGSINQQVTRGFNRIRPSMAQTPSGLTFRAALRWAWGPRMHARSRGAFRHTSASGFWKIRPCSCCATTGPGRSDLQAKPTESTRLQGEAYMGSLLGSYNGAIFQGTPPSCAPFAPPAAGSNWNSEFSRSSAVTSGPASTPPNNNDLSAGSRAFNAACWANLYWEHRN